MIEQYIPRDIEIDISFALDIIPDLPGIINDSLIIVETVAASQIDFDALRALKYRMPSSPMIILSDRLSEHNMREAFRSRVRDFVILPEEHDYLPKLIEQLLKYQSTPKNNRDIHMINSRLHNHILHREIHNKTEKALFHIHNNYQQKILVKDLADLCRMHTTSFARVFREEHGCTIRDYIKKYRISAAMKLLCKTKLSIENVAYNVGFETISLFNRLFKQITGLSPSMYRQEKRTTPVYS